MSRTTYELVLNHVNKVAHDYISKVDKNEEGFYFNFGTVIMKTIIRKIDSLGFYREIRMLRDLEDYYFDDAPVIQDSLRECIREALINSIYYYIISILEGEGRLWFTEADVMREFL